MGPEGGHSRLRWKLLKFAIAIFGLGLRAVGLYRRGLNNALDIQLTRFDLWFPDLPPAFDGFQILQLSDLHVDSLPKAMDAARELAAGVEVDLCVLTGDFRFRVEGAYEQILPGMKDLVDAVRAMAAWRIAGIYQHRCRCVGPAGVLQQPQRGGSAHPSPRHGLTMRPAGDRVPFAQSAIANRRKSQTHLESGQSQVNRA